MTDATEIDANTIDALKGVSTATIATLLFKHGIRNAYVQGVVRLGGRKPTMVGPAFTLRYMAAREDTDRVTEFRNPDHPQRQAIEQCPEGHVLVMDCRGDASAASAGSILLTRLEMRGGAGVVTDGGIRDADGAGDLKMPVYAAGPCALTNLTKHHAIDIDTPVTCGTCPVYPGDIVVGDGDGVMIIPSHMARDIVEEAASVELYEEFVLGRVREGAAIIGLYPATDPANLEAFEAWKTARG